VGVSREKEAQYFAHKQNEEIENYFSLIVSQE
jgi:hypothetical protein